MADSFNSGRTLGSVLLFAGIALGAVALAWLVTNVATGALQPGGFVLGLFFLMLLIMPLVLAGFFLRRRGAAETVEAASFDERRKLFERDRLFRQSLQREATRTVVLLGTKSSETREGISETLKLTQRSLERLSEEASQPIAEADWLHAATLETQDALEVERYGDLLLAGLRRIRETVTGKITLDEPEAKGLLDLARSVERQYTLRQDLLIRGRKPPAVSPLHLLRAELPGDRQIVPELLEPGGAVSHEDRDYLVTAHVTYFDEGQEIHSLVLRGEGGTRLLLARPGDNRVLFMEPVEISQLPELVEKSGTASVTIDSLTGKAEGVVVDYRLTVGLHGRLGWWERWPEGEKAYAGQALRSSEFQFWPSAVWSDKPAG